VRVVLSSGGVRQSIPCPAVRGGLGGVVCHEHDGRGVVQVTQFAKSQSLLSSGDVFGYSEFFTTSTLSTRTAKADIGKAMASTTTPKLVVVNNNTSVGRYPQMFGIRPTLLALAFHFTIKTMF
jgi:hypothetical protein